MYMQRLPYGLGASGSSSSSGGASVTTSLIQAGISAAMIILAGPIKKLISGCGPSCVMASNYANDAQNVLYNNLKTYMALPKPRAASVQAAFLNNFDTVWNHFEAQCAAVGGTPGANCIGDRQAGACKYKANGECWNYFVGFRDPIANDPDVVPDSALTTSANSLVSSLTGGAVTDVSASTWGLLALAGVAALIAAS